MFAIFYLKSIIGHDLVMFTFLIVPVPKHCRYPLHFIMDVLPIAMPPHIPISY